MQLLTDPLVIVCDEPTTGLDSFNAGAVVKTLKQLAEPLENGSVGSEHGKNGNNGKNGNGSYGTELQMLSKQGIPKAVICSIHQPTSEIFRYFTHIILMHNGRCAFQGTTGEAADHFTRLDAVGNNFPRIHRTTLSSFQSP